LQQKIKQRPEESRAEDDERTFQWLKGETSSLGHAYGEKDGI
jgi:hypothetical protein